MGFNIAKDPLQLAAYILAVVGVAVAILATILRFEATKRAARNFNNEDVFAAVATSFFIYYVVMLLKILTVMDGRAVTELTVEETITILNAGLLIRTPFWTQQTMAKGSLIYLYLRMFSVNRAFVRASYVVLAIQATWLFAADVLYMTQCTPLEALLDPEASCIDSPALFAWGETPNALVDFALIGLAIWMMQGLQMELRVKIKLGVLCALGGLAGILGFFKVGQGFARMTPEKVDLIDPITAIVQQTCSIIYCCAPVYGPLFPRTGLFQGLRSLTSRAETHPRSDEPANHWMQHDKEKLSRDPLIKEYAHPYYLKEKVLE